MNVLVVNAYSARNRGDGMIVSQMVRLFTERGCAVKVMSDDPEDGDRYGVERLAPLAPIWPTAQGRPSKAQIARRLASDWLRARTRPPSAFRWADVCVSAGGGYLYDDGGRGSRLNLLRRLLPLRAARRAGVPVVVFSQSIGPFASGAWERIVAGELRRARLVIAREELSAEVCRRLGVRAELCDDVAFALEPAPEPAKGLEVEGRTVGVTVINALPGLDRAAHRRYLDALADGLCGALEGRHESVAVISQVSAHARDDDVAVGRELAASLARSGVEARFVDLGDVSDEELSAFYGRLRLVVASRLHSGILALCAGTPIVALSYLPKTDGVLARLGLERWVLPAGRLDPVALRTTVSAALEHEHELRAIVGEQLPRARESAVRAVDLTLSERRARAAQR